jgi:hypothetical protein
MVTLSLDSQASEASLASLWQEVERTLGCSSDPLDILIDEEEAEFDDGLALGLLQHRHNI